MQHSMENEFIIEVIKALEGETPTEDILMLLKKPQFDLSKREDYPTIVHQLQSLFATLQIMLSETEDVAPTEGAAKE